MEKQLLLVCYRTVAMICTISNNVVTNYKSVKETKFIFKCRFPSINMNNDPERSNLRTKNSLLFILLMSAISGSHFPVIKSQQKRRLVRKESNRATKLLRLDIFCRGNLSWWAAEKGRGKCFVMRWTWLQNL